METDNFQKLQQEAIRRAQEMQRQASRIQNAHFSAPNSIPVASPHNNNAGQSYPQQRAEEPAGNVQQQKRPASNVSEHSSVSESPPNLDTSSEPQESAFSAILKDGERNLLLSILLLLMEEKSDPSLLLAFLYMLL
ncbi:hypothetical protein [Caproicibacterium sp. BJN0003]|uniref:hypothetical protein n=1 Tax=Caproicibacterium sp. BJN0003 TaxID=2994078 RepID=UPI002258CB9F|nr:hypothetical protein [Caproicibacterium sp. BJN0003]UZT82284.1 hypothetical protein OP489_00310 [Caproicibacterium sp. BJN0003]